MPESEKPANPVSAVLDAVKQRLDHQIFGPFVIAWLIYNWDFIAILIAGPQDMVSRVAYLKANYCGWSMLWPPVFITIVYVVSSQWVGGAASWNVEAAKAFWGNLLVWIEKRKRTAWIFRQPASVHQLAKQLAGDEDRLDRRSIGIDEKEAELRNAVALFNEREKELQKLKAEIESERNATEDESKKKALEFLESEVRLPVYIRMLNNDELKRAQNSFKGALEIIAGRLATKSTVHSNPAGIARNREEGDEAGA